jgi:hypothetical protein
MAFDGRMQPRLKLTVPATRDLEDVYTERCGREYVRRMTAAVGGEVGSAGGTVVNFSSRH